MGPLCEGLCPSTSPPETEFLDFRLQRNFLGVKHGAVLAHTGFFAVRHIAHANEARADLPQKMSLLAKDRLRYTFEADQATLQDLFAMTPYFYRTSKQGKERLAATPALDVDVDVEIAVYQK